MESADFAHTRTHRYIVAGITAGILIGILEVSELGLVVGFGCVLLCIAISVLLKIKYDLFVLLDIFLLSIVIFEPSPSDLIFGTLIIYGIINQALNLSKIRRQLVIYLLYFVYFLVSTLGIINAYDSNHAMWYLAVTLYLFLFSVFISLYTTLNNCLSLIRAYILSTLFASILGVIGYMGYFSQLLMADSYRVKALFKDPNVFGPFLIPSIIILIDDLRAKRVLKTNTFVHVSIIVINTVAVILSFSRAAWINLCITVLVYFILNFKRLKLLKVSVFTIVIIMLATSLWFFIADSGLKSFFNERAQLQDYDKYRFASQEAGLQLAYQNPFGYGPGQYELEVIKITRESLSAHNLYIRVIAENGVVGFVMFFASLILIVLKLFIIQKAENENTILKSSVLLSIIIGIMVNSLVVDTLHWRHLWFFIGLSLFSITEYPNYNAHPLINTDT